MSKSSILVVDDAEDNLFFLETLLAGANYHVQTAVTGKLALTAIDDQIPDLLILDINMPVMGGLEVCQQIRQKQELKKLPVLFISGATGQKEEEAVANAGGTALIAKPFSINQLLTTVTQLLELR